MQETHIFPRLIDHITHRELNDVKEQDGMEAYSEEWFPIKKTTWDI